MPLAESRARLLATKGRPMLLRRETSTSTRTDLTVQGYLSMYRADQVGEGSIQAGDGQVNIGNDEIAASEIWAVAAGGPPRSGDKMLIDNRTWRVLGSTALYDGATCIGHTLTVRGG